MAHAGTYVARVQVAKLVPIGPGTWAGEGPVVTVEPAEYFRIEPTSSVLTFWIVIGTLITGIATLFVAIASLVA
jgi:hypothetical protein